MRRFDVLVVGAGPAGSAAAATAARLGLRVGICDRHRFPRAKLCGGAVTGRAMAAYRAAFDHPKPDAPMRRETRVEFHAFGHEVRQMSPAPALRLAMRHSLDAALLDGALSLGAVDLTGQALCQVTPQGARLGSGLVAAPVVIAADGVNSPVARQLFGQAFDRRHIGFALEVELPDPPDHPGVRIDFGAATWGYGWRFPKTCGTTIGVGGVLSRNADMKAHLAAYLDHLGLDPATPPKGQFLPFGEAKRMPGRDNVLLAGDAAGLVDPITGEGIAYALQSGRLAAESAAKALQEGQPARALTHYRHALRPIHRNIANARHLRRVLFAPWFRGVFVRGMRRSQTLSWDYLAMLDGQIEYDRILARFALRLPRHLSLSLGGKTT